MTVEDFITETGITMGVVNVPHNPNMQGDMPKGSAHCRIDFECEGKMATTYYSVGPGIVEHAMEQLSDVVARQYRIPHKPWPVSLKRSIDWHEALQRFTKDYKPETIDVLQCLHSDFSGLHSYNGFGDWAECFGYDTDSRRAEASYNTCLKMANEFCNMVGAQQFQKFCEIEADW